MPAVPTKLFDVRQGNQSVDADATVYPRATLIVFRDNAAKDAVIDAFCDKFGFVPSGEQTKQQFFNSHLQNHIRAIYREQKAAAAGLVAAKTAGDAADAELL